MRILRKIAIGTIIGAGLGLALGISSVSASHLPIEFGKERSERVTICFNEPATFDIVRAEIQFTKDNDLDKLNAAFLRVFSRGVCLHTEIQYTPIETVCQYPGKSTDSTGAIFDATTSVLLTKNRHGERAYVFVPDEAPAVRTDICKAAGLY